MKLATLDNGRRDGSLVVVSKDLAYCSEVAHIAPTLQAAIDDWAQLGPRLEEVARGMEAGAQPVMRFHEHDALSPLPRAYAWADGSAYLNHVRLVRQARGAEMPQSFLSDPLLYQGGSDSFLAPRAPIFMPKDVEYGVDLEAEVAVIVDDVPMGASRKEALQAIRLIMLANDVSLRHLVPNELAKGFGFFQSKPSTAFSPVAVTPEELGERWHDGKLDATITVTLNDSVFGRVQAGREMQFDFGDLIAHAARTRPLGAGSIIGSGTVSNSENGGPARPVAEGGIGYGCIAERRMIETIESGETQTEFLRFGDRVRIEALDDKGHSLFGAIAQTLEPYHHP